MLAIDRAGVPRIAAVRFNCMDLRFKYAILFVEGVLGLHWRSEQRHVTFDLTHGVLSPFLLIVHNISND